MLLFGYTHVAFRIHRFWGFSDTATGFVWGFEICFSDTRTGFSDTRTGLRDREIFMFLPFKCLDQDACYVRHH